LDLICPQCKHRWEEPVAPDQQMVQCPECFGVFAPKEAEGAAAPTSKPPPPQAPASDPTAQTLPPSSPVDVTAAHSPTPGSSTPTRPRGRVAEEMQHLVGQTIGGYQILELLGAGGMGAVFRARQISLDREVALKILPDRFAQNPEAMARFTREALSAAQMSHHNIIQVHDVGSDRGHHFISLEYVRGQTLGDLIRKDGRLNVDDAAGYVLQAARGLRYAHERGIIHRDIKPDNLMLNEHGIVKIADMGLAKSVKDFEQLGEMPTELELKQADAELTLADRGLGTPAYMPPEQARDARSVDTRADQYSLGCTLYYLCAGRAPYSGTTAFELITKHMREPMTPLDVHVRNVPEDFKAIIERMLAKNPDDRYPDMVAVAKDLESHLGVESDKGPYTPREQHVAALETSLAGFYGASMARVRRTANLAFFGVGAALVLFTMIGGNWALGGGLLGLLVLAPVFGFVIDGVRTKGYLFRRVRSVFFGMTLRSWVMLALGCAGGVAALYVLGWLAWWIAFAVVALALAIGFQIGVSRRLRAEREEPIDAFLKTLRELRIRGVSEEAIQEFVCRFSDVHWEEFFETLFGYEAMLHARVRWAAQDQAKPRKKWATWREPIARRLDKIEAARRAARERRALAKVEVARLRAMGRTEKEAEAEAAQEADNFVAAEKVKRERVEETMPDLIVASRREGRSKASLLFSLVRGIAGLLVVAVAALPQAIQRGIEIPDFALDRLADYWAWGQGGALWGLAVGLVLLVTAFSGRLFAPALSLLGTVLVVGYEPIVGLVSQPQFTVEIAFWGGLALAAAGLALCLMGKMSGGRF
jgi:eukaryotic-like serine/threonine-protein kinase